MTDRSTSRRSFLVSAASSAAALSASASLSALAAAAPVHTGVGQPLKIGLVGCGGRGSGAARQAIDADPDNVLWAVGDAFADRLEESVKALDEALAESGRQGQLQVPAERRFVGL